MIIKLPRVFSVNSLIEKNRFRQLAFEAGTAELTLTPFTSGKIKGFLSLKSEESGNEILFINKSNDYDLTGFTHVVLLKTGMQDPLPENLDISDGLWLKHPLITPQTPDVILAS
ncbi:MAG: hypothetical protein V4588_00970, partial [Pseudomonadota bacterium]